MDRRTALLQVARHCIQFSHDGGDAVEANAAFTEAPSSAKPSSPSTLGRSILAKRHMPLLD